MFNFMSRQRRLKIFGEGKEGEGRARGNFEEQQGGGGEEGRESRSVTLISMFCE